MKLLLTYMRLMNLRYILSITFLFLLQELLELSFSLLHLKPSFLLFQIPLIKLTSVMGDLLIGLLCRWWMQMSEFHLVFFLNFKQHFVVLLCVVKNFSDVLRSSLDLDFSYYLFFLLFHLFFFLSESVLNELVEWLFAFTFKFFNKLDVEFLQISFLFSFRNF